MANFSYAFFILRAEDIGTSIAIIPLLYLVHNFFYAGVSAPVGILGDRIGKKNILAAGYLLFALVTFAFSQVSAIYLLWILFAFYGIFMGVNDGLSKAYVADLSKKGQEGRSQGAYGMIAGIVTLPANTLGGLIWNSFGVQYAFYYASILSGIAAIILYFLIEEKGKDKKSGKLKAEKFRFYR